MSAQTNKPRQPEKNPSTARSSWRRPSQTTRILENIEWLIALHERQDGDDQGELARLVGLVESWKKETHRLLEESNALVGGVEKQTTEQIALHLDGKSNEIIEAVESRLNERVGSLDRCVSALAENIGKWTDSGQHFNQTSTEPDPAIAEMLSQQYLELECRLDLLTKHFDEKTDRVLESVNSPGGVCRDCQDRSLVEERLEEFGHKIAKMSELVELQVCLPVGSGSVEDEPRLARQIELQKRDFANDIEQASDRFDQKTRELTEAIQFQVEDQVEKKIEGIFLSFNARIDDLFGCLENRLSQFSENISRQENTSRQENISRKETSPVRPPVAPSDKNSASHWHRQKAAMLSKYGIDPDYRPLKDLPESTDNVTQPEVKLEKATERLESLHNSIENISVADAEAIENLKQELTSKLRDAEVEFSINRARLSQLKAELDGKQVELDRRAAVLEEKYGGSNSTEMKSGFLDRLTRHLSLRKIEPMGE